MKYSLTVLDAVRWAGQQVCTLELVAEERILRLAQGEEDQQGPSSQTLATENSHHRFSGTLEISVSS